MNQLTVFNFNNNKVRIDSKSKQTMFCLVDVCNVLGIKDRRQIRQRLNTRGMCLIPTPSNSGVQKTYYINEPNLYRVILRSDKPVAREFENWVCEEVLPSIRKTGVYACGEVAVREHTRSLPSGKKEIVLSEKAKTEIGGIVKACLSSCQYKPKVNEKEFIGVLAGIMTSGNLLSKHDDLMREAEELRYQVKMRERQAKACMEAANRIDEAVGKVY